MQKKPARRRYENYSMYSDDDANSDASSACSERSYSSRNGGAIPTYMRQTEDVAEVSSRRRMILALDQLENANSFELELKY